MKRTAVWFMLHSGSRGVGNRIGSYFIELAREDMRRLQVNLPDKDLAYFPEGDEVLQRLRRSRELGAGVCSREPADHDGQRDRGDSAFRRSTARSPRICRRSTVITTMSSKERHYGEEVYITRKGAVRAGRGELGIIPGSMGTRSYIVRGFGNPESFESCSHGAGRAMSRGEAKRRFTVQDHARMTEGIECRKDADVIDETPAAYKPIDAVMAAQKDLVEVVHELRQVVVVKG